MKNKEAGVAHRVTFKVAAKAELGPSDVIFKAYDDDVLIGTLMVSQGGIEWRSAKRSYVGYATWERFDGVATRSFGERKLPTPKTRRRQREQAQRRRKPAKRRAR